MDASILVFEGDTDGIEEDLLAFSDELHEAIEAFHRHTGELQPHFAYGRLSKAEYELAHAMHLANHLAAFDISPAA